MARYRHLLMFVAILYVVVLSLSAANAAFGQQHEPRDIQAAVRRGEVLPLPRILDLAQKRVPGEVLEVELEKDGGKFVYEVKMLTPDGRVREVTIDAHSGKLLTVEDD